MARCRGCGLRLHRSSDQCPRCGLDSPVAVKVPTLGRSTPRAVVVGILLIAVLAALRGFGENEAPPQASAQAASPLWRPQDQVGDPYANATADHQVKQREEFLAFVRLARFAFDCKVFPGVDTKTGYAFLLGVISSMGETMGIYVIRSPEQVAAERDGATMAAKPGACVFWRDHPEAVYEMRQAAQAAAFQ